MNKIISLYDKIIKTMRKLVKWKKIRHNEKNRKQHQIKNFDFDFDLIS